VTRVWDGSAFGYYTSSGTATTISGFDANSAIRHRYIAAYQGTTDGTKLQSITASGVYTSHTRATGLTRARAIASGWANGDYALWNACQLLTAMEYRNFFIQDPTVGIGRGRDNYNARAGLSRLSTWHSLMTRAIAHSTTPLMDVIPRLVLMILQPCNGAGWSIITLALGAGSWHKCQRRSAFGGKIYVALNPDRFADSTPTLTIQVRRITLKREKYRVTLEDSRIKLDFSSFPMEGAPLPLTSLTGLWPLTGLRGGGCSYVGGNSVYGAFCGPWLFRFLCWPSGTVALISAP
jgi:hypothetical protein